MVTDLALTPLFVFDGWFCFVKPVFNQFILMDAAATW
jgi:hypothetical protein